MFEHKEEADAVVITRQKLHGGMMQYRSGSKDWDLESWRFVLEVHPPGAAAYRVEAQERIRVGSFPGTGGYVVPDVGAQVRVEYEAKHPEKVRLALAGDDRFDDDLRRQEDAAHQKSDDANQNASFQAALEAPPGTPPDGRRPGSGGDDDTARA